MSDLDLEFPLSVTPEQMNEHAECTFEWSDGRQPRSIRLRLPAGAGPGTRLRFAGQGRVGSRGEAGDLYLRLELQPQPTSVTQEGTQARIAGVVLLLLGTLLILWTEYRVRAEGVYATAATLLGPVAAALGAGMLIHRPPAFRSGHRGNAYAVVGIAIGLGNLFRFGAFQGGWATLAPVLGGLGGLVLYHVYVRSRTMYDRTPSGRTRR
jgi:hypothetical protein